MRRGERGEVTLGGFFYFFMFIIVIGWFGYEMNMAVDSARKERNYQEIENKKIAAEINAFFKGEHKLRRIVERSKSSGEISGSGCLVLFTGKASFNGKSSTEINAKFAWDIGKNVYIISSLPLEKIRVEIDEKATIPKMRFKWNPSESLALRSDNIQRLIDESVIYATVRVKEGDWPAKISLLE